MVSNAAESPALRLRRSAQALLCAATLVGAVSTARGETSPAPPPAADAASRRSDLSRLEDEIKLSDETVARLQAEIKGLDADRDKLKTQLLETGTRSRETEAKIAATEGRLAGLSASEDGIKASLKSRQSVLIEVIAALQRMGRRPPPALLVRPEDALESVRTAMMRGSISSRLDATRPTAPATPASAVTDFWAAGGRSEYQRTTAVRDSAMSRSTPLAAVPDWISAVSSADFSRRRSPSRLSVWVAAYLAAYPESLAARVH